MSDKEKQKLAVVVGQLIAMIGFCVYVYLTA